METEALVSELKSPTPDLAVIRAILNKHPELVKGILQDNASALHFAARNDTIYATQLTQLLLNEYNANPNLQNSSGSIPVLWALAASKELLAESQKPCWSSIKSLLFHSKFKLKKQLLYRGSAYKFMVSEYFSEDLGKILQEAKWEKIKPIVWAKQKIGFTSLV